ncbi:MAG: helix-hairpin-helix domain-containing protein, partial [Candidatus Aphodosoma sp.]
MNHIATSLSLPEKSVNAVLHLLDDGATIPFIARYRKEATGGLDEVAIGAIAEAQRRQEELEHRKSFVTETIEATGGMTDELRQRIAELTDTALLEDIYLPYKQKRRTRATAAREAGLEPLAKIIMAGRSNDIWREAGKFVNDKIKDRECAISGAQDIIAEWVSENETARDITRRAFTKEAVIKSRVIKGKETEGANYADYFDKEYRLTRCPSHALLAMRRGEAEKILRVSISVDDDRVTERLYSLFIKPGCTTSDIIASAVRNGYKRLLCPSIETEFAASSKQNADTEAIRIFSNNLHQLLLAAPIGQVRTMGIDPGFRTGCKIVCLDAQGTLLHNDTIYPHPPRNERNAAIRKLRTLVGQYQIDAIAIGNGTAGRETEDLIRNIRFDRHVRVFSVNENGASIYSASEAARQEFPDYDVTVRGAVSIGRRLMDPLAELVKIEPKSIGVGQYQHDVDQTRLRQALNQTVENCVNQVGVELNNASVQLLTYIAGIGPRLAQNIVDYRTANGAFTSRAELLKVPKMGAKTYQQCAGFIRVAASANPLDHSAVHPESYHIVEQMAKDCGTTVKQLMA